MPSPEETEEVGELPVFESPPDEERPPDPAPPKEDRTPSQASSSQSRPTLPPSRDETTTRSSTGSSEAEASLSFEDVKDAIGDLGAGLFVGLAAVLNRIEQKRTRRPTQRWLATEDEARGFGELAEQYVAPKIPESLTEGDGAAIAVGGLQLVGYVARHLLRNDAIDPVVGDAPPDRVPEPPRPAPPPAPAAPPAPAPRVHTAGEDPTTGARPPEPGPIPVIGPDI